MTLNEAIAKAKADGDVQLAEWLRQARGADAVARWYTEKLRDANRTIRKLLDENAKLRERAVAELSELRGVVSEGNYVTPSGRYFLFRRDVAAYEDALRELGIEVPS